MEPDQKAANAILSNVANKLNREGAKWVHAPSPRCYTLETYAEEYNSMLDKAGYSITNRLGLYNINLDACVALGIDTKKVYSGLPIPPPPLPPAPDTPWPPPQWDELKAQWHRKDGEYNRQLSIWTSQCHYSTFFNEYPDHKLGKFERAARSEIFALKNIVSDVRSEVENGLLTHEDILLKLDERLDKFQAKFEEQQAKFEEQKAQKAQFEEQKAKFEEQQAQFEEQKAKFEEQQAKFEERLDNVAAFIGGISQMDFFSRYLKSGGLDIIKAQEAISSDNNRFKVTPN
jgi:hypothetical protein